MAQFEDDIEDENARIIWVLERNNRGQPGSAADCRNWVGQQGASKGICVGDVETMPMAGVFDRSPLAKGRGFDLIVRRSTMVIEFVSTHGTPSGNDNLSGDQLLDKLRDL